MNQLKENANNSYKEVLDALDEASPKVNDRRNFMIVSESTGLTSSWLSAFANEKIKDAGFKKMHVLSSFLKSKGFLKKSDDIGV